MQRYGVWRRASDQADVGRRAPGLAWLLVPMRRCAQAMTLGFLLAIPTAQAGVSLNEPGCAAWLATRSADAKDWVLGYLSGMNLVWSAERKLPHEPLAMVTSADDVFAWLDKYCNANPRHDLGRGAIVLFFELVKRKEGK